MKRFSHILKLIIPAGILWLYAADVQGQQITINEFMSSNSATIADEDGDFEDWIEVYNFGTEPVNLSGFGLSDDLDEPFRWVFPEVTLQPGGFLPVWASGKNRTNTLQPLHTNFSIKAEGEELLLSNPTGQIICEIAPLNLPTDISYGQSPDANGVWLYFDEPTPGQSNATQGYSEILEPPIFSHNGGFYSEELELTLSHPDPDVTIYYTLDGSIPDPDNLEGTIYYYKNQYPEKPGDPFGEFFTESFQTYLYTDAIQIKDRNETQDKLTHISTTVQTPNYFPASPVKKGTVIRVRTFNEDAMSSNVVTHTYFITPPGINPHDLPVISIGIQEDYLFDYEKGIYTAGIDADVWRTKNPNEKMIWQFPGNFVRGGIEWEYPAHFEFFERESVKSNFRQDIGLRLHGGGTRAFPMKTLRLYARNEYGKSEMNYPFFPDQPYDNYKRMILRNSGNDFPTNVWWWSEVASRTLFRDAFIHTLVKHLSFETQAYRPAVVYINGEYWGIHNLRERYDKYYFERVFGVDPENIDFLSYVSTAIEGDNVFTHQTRLYIEQNGLVSDEHFQYIKTRIDTENFTDYHIANIYACNTDWPGNNIEFWRLRTDSYNPNTPYGHDGRLRWIMFDTDYGFGLWNGKGAAAHNTLDFATAIGGTIWPNPEVTTFLLRKFLENERFKIEFINRFADLLNSTFHSERVVGIINDLKEKIEPEINDHIHRWGYHKNKDEWMSHVNVMIDFAKNRPTYQHQHIIGHFELAGDYKLILNVSNPWHGHIRVNTIEIHGDTPGITDNPYPWKGIYFKKLPLELEAIPDEDFLFSNWEGDVTSNDHKVIILPENNFSAIANFEWNKNIRILHAWFFGTSLPNDTPLDTLKSTFGIIENGIITYNSSLAGYPYYSGHPNWRKASMERRNSPTPLNYFPETNNDISYENADMRGIQIKQPFKTSSGENTLLFHLPTTGFENIKFCFAAKNEGAAEKLLIDYSISNETVEWISSDLSNAISSLSTTYQLFEYDFSQIEAINSNPDFRIRIRFDGANMFAENGKRVTFNNISLEGIAIDPILIDASAGNNGTIHPSGTIPIRHKSNIDFSIIPIKNHYISEFSINGRNMLDTLMIADDNSSEFKLENVIENHTIYVGFSIIEEIIKEHVDGVIIYPNPANQMVHISSLNQIKSIKIFSLRGQLLNAFDSIYSNEFSLITENLNNGLFVLMIETNKEYFSKKLSIIKK
jgi:hypothetical protein